MKKNQKYSILNKKKALSGRLGVILGCISAAAFLFCVIVSVVAGGKGGTFIGAVGLASMLLPLYGLTECIKDLSANKNRIRITYLGAALCGAMFFLWLAIFLAGIKR